MARTLTITLGDLQKAVEDRVSSGAYTSASEVVRAGLRALEREEHQYDAWLKARVEETLRDPRPGMSLKEAFEQVRARHEARTKAEKS